MMGIIYARSTHVFNITSVNIQEQLKHKSWNCNKIGFCLSEICGCKALLCRSE
ncbi:unnamed protein product [Chironomus riparius]|uniref:Uncharacterized protein n=1 Tax=Chironomus riparius TaxID=315576 RepID=A0A9N9S7V2_9DIPT|nr:unnamed protein product [Chironomus riparius]